MTDFTGMPIEQVLRHFEAQNISYIIERIKSSERINNYCERVIKVSFWEGAAVITVAAFLGEIKDRGKQ